MHYHVITEQHQSIYQNRTRWLTFWKVEVTRDDSCTYTLQFGGRLRLQRGLKKLDQQIATANAQRQAEAKAKAATLKKRHYHTWWEAKVDRKTGKVKVNQQSSDQTR
jgi:hypothetical protein